MSALPYLGARFGTRILRARSKLAFKAILLLSFIDFGTILVAYVAGIIGAIGRCRASILLLVFSKCDELLHPINRINMIRFFKTVSLALSCCHHCFSIRLFIILDTWRGMCIIFIKEVFTPYIQHFLTFT